MVQDGILKHSPGLGLLEPCGCHSPAPQSSPVFPGGHRHCPVTRWQGAPTQEQEPEQFTPNVPTGHSVGESRWLQSLSVQLSRLGASSGAPGTPGQGLSRGESWERPVWGIGRGRAARGAGNLSRGSYGHPGPWRAPRSRGPFLLQDGPSRGPVLASLTKVCQSIPSTSYPAPQQQSCSRLLAE